MASVARDYVDIAINYAKDVSAGKITAGQYTRLAARRFLKDLERKPNGRWFPFYFDEWHACDVCDFIEKLPHVEGEWKYPTLVLEPWQIFILVNLFGFRRAYGPRKGARRFDTAYVEVGRKNGKSPLASGIALYCLTCEGETGPQVKIAATTGQQARIVYEVARAMVEMTSDLRAAFSLDPMTNTIVCHQNMGTMQPINAKASTQDGLNPSCTIIDELHAHKDRKLFDVLRSARGARKNHLSLYITTAGYNLAGVCYEQRTYVTKILKGVLKAEHYFGVIYTLDEKDNPYQEKNWIKPNPNIDISVDRAELKQSAKDAKAAPQSEGEFLTKRMNLWLSAASAWISIPLWDKCKRPGLKLEDFEGCTGYIGADLADRNDTVALVLVFERDDVLYVFPFFFLPKDIVDAAADRTNAHYKAWAKQGLITLTEGNITDYSLIEDTIVEWCERFDIRKITFDQYGSAQIASNLVGDGYPAQVMHKNAKNYTDPSKELEARYQVGRLAHDGNEILRWMASNAVVTKGVDGSIIPKKETKDSPNKIDGIDGVIMGIAGLMQDQDEEYESIYEQAAIH